MQEVTLRLDAETPTVEEVAFAPATLAEVQAFWRGTAEAAYQRRRDEFSKIRDAGINAGAPWTTPLGTQDRIDLRRQEDRTNLLGLAMMADRYTAAGINDPAIVFTSASDIDYTLTPDQARAMTDLAAAWVDDWHQATRQHKLAVKAIFEDPALTENEKIDAINAYDPASNGGWPDTV
jgi:hypothetical protein